MMRKGFLLIVVLVLASAWLRAADIPITNFSFEAPAIADPGSPYLGKVTWVASIPGWAIVGGTAGVWRPFLGQTWPENNTSCPEGDPSEAFIAGITAGNQVAYSNAGDLEQTIIGYTVTPGYRYTLKVKVGGRCAIYATKPYAVILAGTSTLGTVGGNNVADSWVEQTVSYTSPPSDTNAGQTLKIKLVNYDSVQLDFDNVRLDASRVLTCEGFLSPFDQALTIKKKENRAIPVKMVLRDLAGNIIIDTDLSAPPKVQVTIGDVAPGGEGYNTDLLPAGLSDDGNEFRYDAYTQQWIINLGTKQFTGAGTYDVTVVPGSGANYVFDSNCQGTFTRLP